GVRGDVGGAQMPLAVWTGGSGLTYVGWEPEADDIVVFAFAPLAGQLKPAFTGPFKDQIAPPPLPERVGPPAAKEAPAKDAPAKEAPAKEAPAKKPPTKKPPTKKAPAKKAGGGQ